MPKLDYSLKVTALAQTKGMSCWAAAAAMLLGWKSGLPYTERMAASAAGKNFELAFDNDQGLLAPEVVELAKSLHLGVEEPKNVNASGWDAMLREYGPLWVGTAIFGTKHVYRHVRVVRGVRGDGTGAGTRLVVLDPDGGRDYQVTVEQFAKELEQIAKQDIAQNTPLLLPQILHF